MTEVSVDVKRIFAKVRVRKVMKFLRGDFSMNYYYVRENEVVSNGVSRLFQFSKEKLKSEKQESEKQYWKIKVPAHFLRSSIIALFNKPTEDIVCPHFWEFKPFIGCPFECSYCYLNGTFFGNKKPRMKEESKIVEELEYFLKWADQQGLKILLNAGELADSLAIPEWTQKIIEKILPILEGHPNHKILFLTKGGKAHIRPLLDGEKKRLKRFFIISFSLNPERISSRYERGAAKSDERISAAKVLQDEGYIVRIRIDPMIPVSGWRIDYALLLKKIFENYALRPERITLGSLRGLKKTLKFTKDAEWVKYLDKSKKTRWGLKIEVNLRIEMYAHLIKKINEFGYEGKIALCKETIDVWEKLSDEGLLPYPGKNGVWENVQCNCKL